MNSKRDHELLKVIRCPYGNENGVVLMVVLIFVGILALVGATATIITTTDTKIGANYKTAEKALYVAEAGAHEARERLRPSSAYPIIDWHTDKYQWSAFIGTDPKTQKKGYDSNNAMHVKVASLQTDMDYTVVITHQLDTTDPTKVLYWGDDDGDGEWTRNTTTGENIYLITSYGDAEGSTKIVQLEVTRVPPITIKGALYSGTSANILGSVTIDGNDSCGGTDLPGIATPQAEASSPVDISGASASVTGDEDYGDPNVKYSEPQALDVQSMANFLKKSADFSYNVNSETQSSSETPGPGDGWGTPDLTAVPPTCDSCNIVHYDTNDTYIKLVGPVSGCGILVVEGDLDANGGFSWYGTVIVTGSFIMTGGGSGDKKIAGAVITGESTDGDIIGGSVNIDYCSTATEDQNEKHALYILSWKEALAE